LQFEKLKSPAQGGAGRIVAQVADLRQQRGANLIFLTKQLNFK